MLGAIIGDIVGSPYEFNNIKTTVFHLFSRKSYYTDDTILTIAICDAVLKDIPFKDSLIWWANRYPSPYGDYGGLFRRWLCSDENEPYGSFGNGSAMRVSSIGWLYNSLVEVLIQAENSAIVTHNHPEGIKGAQATAAAIYMSRTGSSKQQIRNYIQEMFGYDLSRSIDKIRPHYTFDGSCQGTVPEAILCFLESTDFESAIRLAVSLGGDSDTLACITGSIAESYYQHIPLWMIRHAVKLLPYDIWLVLYEFSKATRQKNDTIPYFFFNWENIKRKFTQRP